MAWWSSLLGGSKAAEKGMDLAADSVKGIGNWIDGQQFTDQEKSEALANAGKLHLKLVELTANENSVRSITRRVLAWAIMGSFITLLMLSVLVYKLDQGYSEYIFRVATESDLGMLSLAVGVFYFGHAALRTIKK